MSKFKFVLIYSLRNIIFIFIVENKKKNIYKIKEKKKKEKEKEFYRVRILAHTVNYAKMNFTYKQYVLIKISKMLILADRTKASHHAPFR